MPFKKGNKFWEARSSSGRKPIFADPEQLEAACIEYFQWCEANPLWEYKTHCYLGKIVKESIPKLRAFTIDGLCLFLDITDETWRNYKKRNDDFFGVICNIETAIRNQKFTGAAANQLNANIIARDLGLKDGETNISVHVKNKLSPEDYLIEKGVPLPDSECPDLDEMPESIEGEPV